MLVVDASVALKWFKQEPDTGVAEIVAVADVLTAPELLVAEVANVCWLAMRRSLLTAAQFAGVPQALRRYVPSLHPLRPLMGRAMEIARALDHPAYDCFYLALAEREVCALVTADARLIRRVAGTPWATHVRDLASFPAGP